MSEQGTNYAAFIEAELKAEHARRDSVNSRAATVLTSSAGLVTLALAVFAVIVGKDFILTGSAKTLLVLALAALLCSAACAVVAGFPWRIKLAKPSTLREMIGKKHWGDSEVTARGVAAYTNLEVIESLRPGTNIKFGWLLAAGIFQVVAVAMLAGCTIAVVFTTPQVATQAPPSPSISITVPAISITIPAAAPPVVTPTSQPAAIPRASRAK
jgi:hypothetical protein